MRSMVSLVAVAVKVISKGATLIGGVALLRVVGEKGSALAHPLYSDSIKFNQAADAGNREFLARKPMPPFLRRSNQVLRFIPTSDFASIPSSSRPSSFLKLPRIVRTLANKLSLYFRSRE